MDDFSGFQLRSEVSSAGTLRLFFKPMHWSAPGPDEILVRMEAAPVNPSDLSILFGYADLGSMRCEGSGFDRVITADVPARAVDIQTLRLGKPLPCGNEGVGLVVRAGENAAHLLGQRVSSFGGGMYGHYRVLRAEQCMALGTEFGPREGASSFINPLTVLSMVETMKREGYGALVHTAAASNLGQMLCKVCLEDDIPLVNIVRRPEQADLLRSIGATLICDSSAPDFEATLVAALEATDATLAFDATGGGELADRILACMEKVQGAKMRHYSPYGSPRRKQVYVYGGLDRSPTMIRRSYGMGWHVGGWLFTWVYEALPAEARERLNQRVVAGLRTTFASRYSEEIKLEDMLDPDIIGRFTRMATGDKILVDIAI